MSSTKVFIVALRQAISKLCFFFDISSISSLQPGVLLILHVKGYSKSKSLGKGGGG